MKYAVWMLKNKQLSEKGDPNLIILYISVLITSYLKPNFNLENFASLLLNAMSMAMAFKSASLAFATKQAKVDCCKGLKASASHICPPALEMEHKHDFAKG